MKINWIRLILLILVGQVLVVYLNFLYGGTLLQYGGGMLFGGGIMLYLSVVAEVFISMGEE